MNFSFVPSLQNMAVTRIVTRLYNGGDVAALIAEWKGKESWQDVEKKVKENISLLCQPAPLREKLSRFVVPIGDKIRRWIRMHYIDFAIANAPREFCWTSWGTLDKKGTAAAYVHDQTLPEEERYCMAVFYCLEWDGPVSFMCTSYLKLSKAYWLYDSTRDATALDNRCTRDTSKTAYQRAFHYAVECGNEVAAEYYFRKLSPGERKESLSDVELPPDFNPGFDLFRLLLLHMDEGQRSKLLEEYAEEVLYSLLRWPWQQFFMDVARLVRDALKVDEYRNLLSDITYMIKDGYEDYGYRELFGAFWVEIPPDHQKDLISNSFLWRNLLPFIGEKNISLMMKDLSREEKEEILLCEDGVDLCYCLVQDDEWDSLEFFICKCLSSRDRIIHFKEKCERRRYEVEGFYIFSDEFYQLLNKLIEKGSEKRGGEEEMDCPMSTDRA